MKPPLFENWVGGSTPPAAPAERKGVGCKLWYLTIDYKDPVWMNETIKSKMKAKLILYNKNMFRMEDLKLLHFSSKFNN